MSTAFVLWNQDAGGVPVAGPARDAGRPPVGGVLLIFVPLSPAKALAGQLEEAPSASGPWVRVRPDVPGPGSAVEPFVVIYNYSRSQRWLRWNDVGGFVASPYTVVAIEPYLPLTLR